MQHAESQFSDQELNQCPDLGAQSLNHWTARDVPSQGFLNHFHKVLPVIIFIWKSQKHEQNPSPHAILRLPVLFNTYTFYTHSLKNWAKSYVVFCNLSSQHFLTISF